MTDVKDLCDRILDAPAPPLRDSAQVLAVARHAARRRARLAAAGGLACVALAAGAVTALLPVAPMSTPLAQPSPTAAASRPQVPLPGPDAAQAHGATIAQVLAEAVPPGYTTRPEPTSTWRLAGDTAGGPHYVSVTRLVVSDADGAGTLSIGLFGDGADPAPGDLCGAAATARLAAYGETGAGACAVTSVGGVAVRTDTAADGRVTAVRFVPGGFVAVEWSPSTSDLSGMSGPGRPWVAQHPTGRPALRAAAFTTEALARLAADRRLLP
ncbi:hypothetical protein [Catellatospora tritici]|uniref:hypothetical protein n=1 Tax=Catellatospora tritici TaxID=2851566 RepID=UPI001C2D8BA5|nr:hypothetical protein [Catellatospora tritici]MBV1851813.1 hypothetical protein [Catellatospora tritici]